MHTMVKRTPTSFSHDIREFLFWLINATLEEEETMLPTNQRYRKWKNYFNQLGHQMHSHLGTAQASCDMGSCWKITAFDEFQGILTGVSTLSMVKILLQILTDNCINGSAYLGNCLCHKEPSKNNQLPLTSMQPKITMPRTDCHLPENFIVFYLSNQCHPVGASHVLSHIH